MNSLQAQVGTELTTDSIPDLTLIEDTTKKEGKPRKPKKNVFYGMKCRRAFAREGAGLKEVAELFYCLKKPVEVNPYVNEIYIWDLSKGKIMKVNYEELKKLTIPYKIPHGPYAKYIRDAKGKSILVERGIFYVGTKHGRWEKYNKDNILVGKAKYWRGWQREAKITYYDNERKKIKEVNPREYGEQTGSYYYFSESGQLVTKGSYIEGKKVGMWIEYFPDKNKKQRETQYPKDPYDLTPPVIIREWDNKGNLIINNGEKVDPKSAKDDPIKKSGRRKK
jgi:antitoxin component YwqK of YwqJK toxin-antitoxin module